MNLGSLHELLKLGESLTVEYKSDRRPLSDDELMDAVVCLSNQNGGYLLIGVEDDGTITGLHAKHLTSTSSIAALIASRTVPPISVDECIFDTPQGKVAVLHIAQAHQAVATSDGKLSIRYIDTHGKPGCRPLYPHELVNWQAERGKLDPSSLPITNATWHDLDPLEFTRLRRMIEENHGDAALLELSDLEIAKAMGLVRVEKDVVIPTVAGLLMVGKEGALSEHIPSHEVAFQVLQNDEVRVNDIHRWCLLRTLEWVLDAFQVRNEERELNIGLFRIGVPAYDRRGFREAVNNAFIHRDYTQLGAVHIQMHSDHIRISNPGGFVQGVSPDNLLVTEPQPRNLRLADAFKRIGLVERVGRGVNIIYAGQLRNGRVSPDYSKSTPVSVNVILPGGAADLKFVEFLVTEETRRQHSFGVSELIILAHLWRERTLDTHTAAALTQRGEADARATLENLLEKGLIEARSSGKGRTYLLSASVYRALGLPSSYIYAKGFETEQMEQMILQYVSKYNRITRKEACELCRIGTYQASRFLQKLVDQGKLEPAGKNKGVYYTLRS